MPAPMISHRLPEYSAAEQIQRAESFYEEMDGRRSVRFFSDEPVSRELVELAIKTASTAPSGAHRQPCQRLHARVRAL